MYTVRNMIFYQHINLRHLAYTLHEEGVWCKTRHMWDPHPHCG